MFSRMTDDTKTWWSEQIKSLGFPIVVCVALLWGGYNIFTAFITPVFQKQMETLEDVTSTQRLVVERLNIVSETQSKVVDKVVANSLSIITIIEDQATQKQILKDALVTLKEIEKNTSKKNE